VRSLLPLSHPSLHPLARLRAWHRVLLALLSGLTVAALAPRALLDVRLLAAWLAAIPAKKLFLYETRSWGGMGKSSS
jgi:hypothetical protein